MPVNVNSCHIEGRLTKNGELKFTPNGVAVFEGTLGYNARRKNKQTDQWEDAETQWHRIKAWNKEAEMLAMIPGGTLVGIYGRMEIRYWNSVEGTRREGHEIVVDRLYIPVLTEKVFSVGPDGLLFRTGRSREQAKATGIENAVFDTEPF